MTLKGVAAFTIMAIVGLGVQVEARTPCQEYLRLRNAATEAGLRDDAAFATVVCCGT
jgi:hypothetical protein